MGNAESTQLPNKRDSINNEILDTIRSEMIDNGLVKIHVNGSCMNPAIADGSLIELNGVGWCFPGDIIAYYCPYQKRNFVHRFIGKVPSDGKWKYMLSADNTDRVDILVDAEKVLGKVTRAGMDKVDIPVLQRINSVSLFLKTTMEILLRKTVFPNRKSI